MEDADSVSPVHISVDDNSQDARDGMETNEDSSKYSGIYFHISPVHISVDDNSQDARDGMETNEDSSKYSGIYKRAISVIVLLLC